MFQWKLNRQNLIHLFFNKKTTTLNAVDDW